MTASPLRRMLFLSAVVAAAGLTVAPPAAAAPAAVIRGGHFSPNTPGVDVYLTAFGGGTTKLWLSGVGYGDVSGYQSFRAGLYAVSMRPHGADPSTPAALTWTLNARAGAAYTACAVGLNAQLHGIVLHDDLAPAPSGMARARVIQAASRAGHADVTASGGHSLARNAAFATSTGYATVPAGRHVVRATGDGTPPVSATTHATFGADTVHTVVVLDGKRSGIAVRVLEDAAGAAAPPAGAVPGGGGGTAAAEQPVPGWVFVAALGLVLAGLGVAIGRRGPGEGRTL